MKWFLTFLFVILGATSGFFYYLNQSYFKKPMGMGQKSAVFAIEQGESFASVARRLDEEHLVQNPKLLNLLARFYGYRSKIRAGEYALNDGLSPKDILLILISGKSINYPFTVTEGLNSYEVALLFEKLGFGKKSDFLQACADKKFIQRLLKSPVNHCEGYLFPETYNFEKRTTAYQMVEKMIQSFLQNYQTIAKGRSPLSWTRHQILTMASLIEKETGAPEERPMIASVFYNRLQKHMRLQTDPTVQYGVLYTTGHFPMNITRADLQRPTPYNTYTHEGLPPGPIANPGSEALRAVFDPARSEFLYFVSRNDGTHIFTKTYEEHKGAVKTFQLDHTARDGKSWRDLKKKIK